MSTTGTTAGIIAMTFAAATLGIAVPAQACSCIPPENLERERRAALASADLAAELEIGPTPAPSRLWCGADGRARPWFRPGRRIEQDHSARVLHSIKGRVSGSIRVRGSPIESAGGYCSVQMNSCQIGVSPGRTGPMLFRRIAPGVYRPVDVCTQAVFSDWYARRRSGARKP